MFVPPPLGICLVFSLYLPCSFPLTCPYSRAYIPRMDTPKDLITLDTAREILDVSLKKLRELMRNNLLTPYSNPLDRREKMLSRDEVEGLRKQWKEAA